MDKEGSSYQLIFYNSKVLPILNVPLNRNTNPILEIPNDTCFVSLNTKHLIKKAPLIDDATGEITDNEDIYETKNIYFFIIKDRVNIYFNTKNFVYFFNVPDAGYTQILENYLGFTNEKHFKSLLNDLIKLFKQARVKSIEKDLIYDDNNELKRFEKSLIKILNSK